MHENLPCACLDCPGRAQETDHEAFCSRCAEWGCGTQGACCVPNELQYYNVPPDLLREYLILMILRCARPSKEELKKC